jgi:hypothetical protein
VQVSEIRREGIEPFDIAHAQWLAPCEAAQVVGDGQADAPGHR